MCIHGLACPLPLPSHHQPQEECVQGTQGKKERRNVQQTGTWSAGLHRPPPADPWAHEVRGAIL